MIALLADTAHEVTHDARDAAWIGAGAAIVVASISYLGVRTSRKIQRDLSTGNGSTSGQTLYQVWAAIRQIRDTLGLLVDASRAHEQMLANLDEGLHGLGQTLDEHLEHAVMLDRTAELDRLAREGRIERRLRKEGA